MVAGAPLTVVIGLDMGKQLRPVAFPFEVVPAPVQMKALAMLGDLALLAEYEKCDKKELQCFQQALAEARFVAANSLFSMAIKPNLGSRLPAPAASLEPKEQLGAQEKARSKLVSRHKKAFSRQSTPILNSGPSFHRTQSDHVLPSISEGEGQGGDELPRASSAHDVRLWDADEDSVSDFSESSSDDESAASGLVTNMHDNAEQTYMADAASAVLSRSLGELPSSSALSVARDECDASESDSTPRDGEARAPCRSVSFTPQQNPCRPSHSFTPRQGEFQSKSLPVGNRVNVRESETPQAVDMNDAGVADGDDDQNADNRASMPSKPEGAISEADDGRNDHSDDERSTSDDAAPSRSRAFRSGGSSLDRADVVAPGQFAVPPATPPSRSALIRSSMHARAKPVNGAKS